MCSCITLAVLTHFKQFLFSPTCLKCNSFFSEETLFCNTCYEVEIGSRLCSDDGDSNPGNKQHVYLLRWGENENLREMIYRLKSDRATAAWRFYAGLVAEKALESMDIQSFKALVPVPGSRRSSVHAAVFAMELSKLLDLPVQDVLCKLPASREQKTKSAADRKSSVFITLKAEFHEEFTRSPKQNGAYLFVDDILTTGESFLQSSRALGHSNGNSALTLFYRPRLM